MTREQIIAELKATLETQRTLERMCLDAVNGDASKLRTVPVVDAFTYCARQLEQILARV